MTGDGVRIDGPTASDLNRHRDDVSAEFTHVPGTAKPRPVVYSAVQRTGLWAPREPDRAAEEFTVLNLPFGFPAGERPAGRGCRRSRPSRSGWWRISTTGTSSTTTPPRTWVLDGDGRPVALTLQQHNYLRTHLVGRVREARIRRTLRHRRGHPLERALPPTSRVGRCGALYGFLTMTPGPS